MLAEPNQDTKNHAISPGTPCASFSGNTVVSLLQTVFIHYGPILCVIKVNLDASNLTEANEHANVHSHTKKCLEVEFDNKDMLAQAS